MPNPESHSGTTREEAFARVVWSANILSHLSGRNWQRSQAPLISEDSDEEDSESECDSVVNGLLTASDAAIRRKFLDCLAETLSGAKGWSHVTATVLRETEESVEVVVARNSGKDVEKDDPYLERLQRFMLAEGYFCLDNVRINKVWELTDAQGKAKPYVFRLKKPLSSTTLRDSSRQRLC